MNLRTQDDLTNLRPIAESSLLSNLELSHDLREKILLSVESTSTQVPKRQVTSRRRIASIATAMLVALLGILVAIGVMDLHHTRLRSRGESSSLSAVTTSMSLAAVALLQRTAKDENRFNVSLALI